MDTWTIYCVLILLSATVINADLPFVTDCKDHDQVDCYKIRGTAECREVWVYEFCPLSCGVCGMLKPDASKCEDHNRECDSISSSDHQSCKDIVIKEVCPKSCGVCGHHKHTHPPHLLKTTAKMTAKPTTTTPIPTTNNPTTVELVTDALVTSNVITPSPTSNGFSGTPSPVMGSQIQQSSSGQLPTTTESSQNILESSYPAIEVSSSQVIVTSTKVLVITSSKFVEVPQTSLGIEMSSQLQSTTEERSSADVLMVQSSEIELPESSYMAEVSEMIQPLTSEEASEMIQPTSSEEASAMIQPTSSVDASAMIQPTASVQYIMSSEVVLVPWVTETVATDATVTGEAVTHFQGVSGGLGSEVTDGQMVTSLNEFTTEQGITDVTTDSRITDRIGGMTDNEVTTVSLVTDNEVTTDSLVTNNEVTTDSLVTNNEVTTDSIVTNNEVTTDSLVTDNEVTTDSMVTDNEVTKDSIVTNNEVTVKNSNELLTNEVTDGPQMTDSGITETAGSRVQNTDEPVTDDGFTDELKTQGAVTNQPNTSEHWSTNAQTDSGITVEGALTPDVAVTNEMSMVTQGYSGITEEGSMTPEVAVTNGMMTKGHRASGSTGDLANVEVTKEPTQMQGSSQGPTQTPNASHRTDGVTQSPDIRTQTASLTTKTLTSGSTESNLFTPSPLTKTRCQVCDDPFCRIGFANINYCKQETPYCISSISFDENGKSKLEKRCASAKECDEKWINRSSKMTKCLEYGNTKTYQTNLQCDFCCVKDNCNAHTLPNKETLYTKQ